MSPDTKIIKQLVSPKEGVEYLVTEQAKAAKEKFFEIKQALRAELAEVGIPNEARVEINGLLATLTPRDAQDPNIDWEQKIVVIQKILEGISHCNKSENILYGVKSVINGGEFEYKLNPELADPEVEMIEIFKKFDVFIQSFINNFRDIPPPREKSWIINKLRQMSNFKRLSLEQKTNITLKIKQFYKIWEEKQIYTLKNMQDLLAMIFDDEIKMIFVDEK